MAAAAQTRLDRLVTLLENGSTPGLRSTAARQLGQIAAVRVRGSSSASSSSAAVAASLGPTVATASGSSNGGADVAGGDDVMAETSTVADGKKDKKPQLAEPASLSAPKVYHGIEGDWEQAIFLLARVMPLLRSRAWDTRVASAQAIEAICSAAGVWDPEGGVELSHNTDNAQTHDVKVKEETEAASHGQAPPSTSGALSFDTFSLAHILSTGKKLLSSSGSEYDLPANSSIEERLAHAKRDMQRLGLASMAGEDVDLGVDVERELLGGETRASTGNSTPTASMAAPPALLVPPSPQAAAGPLSPSPLPTPTDTSAPPQEEEIDMSKLSARERNQLKRKRKLEGKTGSSTNLVATPAEKTRVVESPTSNHASSTPGLSIKTISGQSNGATGANLAVESPGPSNGAARLSPMGGTPRTSVPGSTDSATDAASLLPPPGVWPFSLVCSLLLSDLFAPSWETRHGAALGLRELFKAQGKSGGKIIGVSSEKAEIDVPHIKTEDDGDDKISAQDSTAHNNGTRHQQWCDDCAIRLLCVLTLDRLGDFVFDQVIAPVRETAGQALSTLLRWMRTPSVAKVHRILVEMVTQDFLVHTGNDSKEAVLDSKSAFGPDGVAHGTPSKLTARRGVAGYAWEVRHAGLLGLRYEVSVRKELLIAVDGKSASPYLLDVIRLAIICLRDDDDDVRSVAAATLLPIVEQVVQLVPQSIDALLHQLWESLDHLKDDLSSSTGGVMDLLARLVEQPAVIPHLAGNSSNVSDLIPRLFPFFRHTITSVRLAVLNALSTFLSVPSLPKEWADERLIRLLFQNLVVEERLAIREASQQTWQRALDTILSRKMLESTIRPHLDSFFTILMTPLGTPIDFRLFYRASSGLASRETHNVDKGILAQDLALVGVDAVIRGRLGAAQALGSVMAHWERGADEQVFGDLILAPLTSSSALQKCLACIVVQEWAEQRDDVAKVASHDLQTPTALIETISARLLEILESPSPSTYAEMLIMLQRIQRQSQALYSCFSREGKVKKEHVPELPTAVDPLGQRKDAFTIDTAKGVVGPGYDALFARVTAKSRAVAQPMLEEKRARLIGDVGFYQSIKEKQDNQVAASAAAATIALRALPAKLNPVIRSVMNSIKFEENEDLQKRSGRAIARFIDLCIQPEAKSNPSDKIIKNLCAFVCQDTTQTPIFDKVKDFADGILSLIDAETASAATSQSNSRRQRVASGFGSDTSTSITDVNLTAEEREGKLIRRGAEFSLGEIAARFGPRLFDVVPTIWQSWTAALIQAYGDKVDVPLGDATDESGQAIVDCCTLLQVNIVNVDATLMPRLTSLLPTLTRAVQSKYAVIRSCAAQTLAVMAETMTAPTMLHIVQRIVPLLGDATQVSNRQGAIETISSIVRRLDVKLLPYVIVLIVPVLGRMSDANEAVRLVATNTFASLVKMVPLEAGLPDPPDFPEELLEKRHSEREFLAQLLDGNKVEQYNLPVDIKAELRKYQRDGVSWMAFLAKFQLHGILCDDMGLGKTLQSICILASKHFERAQSYAKTKRPEAEPLPSLIICPPTLTGHWCHEIKQYSTNLSPLLYAGHPNERARLQTLIAKSDCVVASYDTVRNDVAVLSKHDWLYCILDEGHVIKSAKAKTTKAVKMMRSQHRLILSGTPVQNNVLELWSLFDFLMPGFLGTEKMFMERYARPILASRDAKMNAKEHERASLALDSLHKQVLPFLLRRMKEDVLSDLPPKIIQDIQCDMSDIQRQMYEDYLRGQKSHAMESAIAEDGDAEEKQHVFQTLQWLRKLVCHPLLVYDPSRPKHVEMQQALTKSNRKMDDVSNAPKLLALKQLLQDCGIGTAGSSADELAADEAGISQHRVLIFCQQRQMLDIIEKDLFQRTMPSVTYARLDGSVTSPEKRFGIVQRFNADPSIDVLLLTTSVGGLGLTLTGADTVIFVEHDWNPMKDMQAMDRAHRLGQKKVVNVYRLITRDTLEEKIMGLQRFKLNVAGNIINQENKGMDSMETDQILDLFDSTSGRGAAQGNVSAADGDAAGKRGVSQKALLAGLESMQDAGDEYAEMQQWQG